MDATHKITKNLGGNRLGSGSKNNISMHAYNRSTHNLSMAWRSTMNVGTLVPFLKKLALPGDTFSIDINSIVRTIPSIGPMYGTYKLQMDVFECPIRLYNGLLHNNMTNIGLSMDQVILPKITLSTKVLNPKDYSYERTNSQIAPDSLLNYLGLRGIGDVKFKNATKELQIERKINAVPILAYYDIYKNYYANKQEKKGVVINRKIETEKNSIKKLKFYYYGETNADINEENNSTLPTGVTTSLDTYQQLYSPIVLNNDLYYWLELDGALEVSSTQILLERGGNYAWRNLTDLFPTYITTDSGILSLGRAATAYNPNNDHKIIGFAFDSTTNTNSTTELLEFPLDNIDAARVKILQNTGLGNEVDITSWGLAPYNCINGLDNENFCLSKYGQQALAIKTYQSDLLQNWLDTEWIDGVNGINQITAIDTSSGSFQIDALNLANKVYNMLNRIAVSGGSYEDYIEAVYTTNANRRAESPIYKGGASAEIAFQEVVSTSETTDKPLGTLAGKGGEYNKKGGKIEIRVDEPGYIIGIVSITPRIDYSQGNDFDLVELDTLDDLHKPALDGIGFQNLLQERAAWFGTYYDEQNSVWEKLAIGKTPAWIDYMTSVNETHGEFAKPNSQMFMTLNRRYEYPEWDNILNTRTMGIADLTSYVDPEKYNYVFADSSIESQNFWIQIGMKIECRRVMSAKILPNL